MDQNLVRLAFTQLVKYSDIWVGSRESVILATMKTANIKRIASHDNVFKKIKNLEVIDSIPKSEKTER